MNLSNFINSLFQIEVVINLSEFARSYLSKVEYVIYEELKALGTALLNTTARFVRLKYTSDFLAQFSVRFSLKLFLNQIIQPLIDFLLSDVLSLDRVAWLAHLM